MNNRKNIAEEIAREIISVQPIENKAFYDLYTHSKSEEELIAEGYKPVSHMRLMWIKDEEK